MEIKFSAWGLQRPSAEPLARRGIESVLRAHKVRSRRVLNLVWTTRERVRDLNRRFRDTNRFTDVIAFRYQDGAPLAWPVAGKAARSKDRFLVPSFKTFGDLYVAVPQARLNAKRFGVPVEEELARLAVHGTLHLLGYTDYEPAAKEKMWAVQEKIVRRIFK